MRMHGIELKYAGNQRAKMEKKLNMKYKRQVNNTSITKEGFNAYDIQSILQVFNFNHIAKIYSLLYNFILYCEIK